MAKLYTKLRRWNDKHVTRCRLARLDERLLTDIGMIRGDIERVASGVR